ncbi:MAG: hypothetical protein HQ518_21035 [Rhodopirellula sp.]|nr:hypothetical protein [Rhodopirellula sp.]
MTVAGPIPTGGKCLDGKYMGQLEPALRPKLDNLGSHFQKLSRKVAAGRLDRIRRFQQNPASRVEIVVHN